MLDGVIGGVTAPIAMIGIGEKGYVSVELTATGAGGHSSMPANDNSAIRIARAVERLADNQMPARINGPSGAMLDGIAPYTGFAMRAALANRWLTGPLVERQLLSVPSTAAAIRTTTAPTILSAGHQGQCPSPRSRMRRSITASFPETVSKASSITTAG